MTAFLVKLLQLLAPHAHLSSKGQEMSGSGTFQLFDEQDLKTHFKHLMHLKEDVQPASGQKFDFLLKF